MKRSPEFRLKTPPAKAGKQAGCAVQVLATRLPLRAAILLALAAALAALAAAEPGFERIYARAANELFNVTLFKPLESTNQSLPFKLAPLILQEVTDTNSALAMRQDYFSHLEGDRDPPGRVPHALYTRQRQVKFNGRAHDQVIFIWFYPPAGASGTKTEQAPLSWQGVRITLNSEGQPVIWEMLANNEAMRMVYVAGSLEHAALTQFKTRYESRRFVIEPDPAEHPDVVVARIIEDGPVVFGPIIYLRAGTRAPATLICRCMPSQAKNIADMRYYRILPLPKNLEGQLKAWSRLDRRRLLRELDRQDLGRILRLPDAF